MRGIFSVLLVSLVAIGATGSATNVTELLNAADQLYDRWSGEFGYDAYQNNLESSIALYQDALSLLPDDEPEIKRNVLLRLSRACFELGEGYLTAAEDVESIHELGKDSALAAMQLDAGFKQTATQSFRAALSEVEDVRAIFWYGNNLGRYLEFHRFTALRGGVRDLQVCFQRAVELDPSYLDGAPLRSLASFYSQVPGILGGDKSLGRELHQQAMALSETMLENAVNWAEYGLHHKEDEAMFCSTLLDVIAQSEDADLMSAWPFYNERAVRRARALLSDSSCEP